MECPRYSVRLEAQRFDQVLTFSPSVRLLNCRVFFNLNDLQVGGKRAYRDTKLIGRELSRDV